MIMHGSCLTEQYEYQLILQENGLIYYYYYCSREIPLSLIKNKSNRVKCQQQLYRLFPSILYRKTIKIFLREKSNIHFNRYFMKDSISNKE